MGNVLVLVTGLPGTGKTYFAKRLAPRWGASYFSSDLLRKQLFAQGRTYTIAEKEQVYSELLASCLSSLESENVVVDANFPSESLRNSFLNAAEDAGHKTFVIRTSASEKTIKERLSQPREDSEADFSIYMKLRDKYQIPASQHLTLQTDLGDVEELIQVALNEIPGHL